MDFYCERLLVNRVMGMATRPRLAIPMDFVAVEKFTIRQFTNMNREVHRYPAKQMFPRG